MLKKNIISWKYKLKSKLIIDFFLLKMRKDKKYTHFFYNIAEKKKEIKTNVK